MVVRCASPVRPGWNQEASRTAPTTSAGLVWAVSGSPSMSTVPVVGLWSPRRQRMVVDLPAPFGPRNPVMDPSGTVKLNPSTTRSEEHTSELQSRGQLVCRLLLEKKKKRKKKTDRQRTN